MIKQNDNLLELHKKFRVAMSLKCADGWCYRCRKCDVACYSREFWADCKSDFVPEKVVCPVCGARWKLKIYVEKPESETVH